MQTENQKNGKSVYNAIETDKGVLLFSKTKEGRKLFNDYLGLFMDNLYNPLCNNTYFNIHRVESGDPALWEKCDIALKFPDRHLPLKIPVGEECFTGTGVLKESVDVMVSGWEPTPRQIQRITDPYEGVHIPIRGDTFDISALQEIAAGVSYNRLLLSGTMRRFSYEKEFFELAKKTDQCMDATEAGKLRGKAKALAAELLERDFPEIRKVSEAPVKEKIPGGYGEHDYLKKDGDGCYNAIEIYKGVLLFSRTKEGKESFQKTLETYLDNFYNPACENLCFNLHYIECDSNALKGMSDLALKFPMAQQREFPISPGFFLDKNVLKYSLQEAKFSWTPEPFAVSNLINDKWDGKHLPMKMGGDTYNISVLKEIASMKFHYFTSLSSLANHTVLGIDEMPGFKYKDDFRELAEKALNFSGHIHQYKVLGAMRDKANELLKRDFLYTRKENEPFVMEKPPVVQTPTQKKKGMGL
ncbi:MAG: hypothetical protein LBL07_20060 [Tannerella sp.]|jgi:hypothetical protein|nr:hypothetical protein [Tannerella sp.]